MEFKLSTVLSFYISYLDKKKTFTPLTKAETKSLETNTLPNDLLPNAENYLRKIFNDIFGNEEILDIFDYSEEEKTEILKNITVSMNDDTFNDFVEWLVEENTNNFVDNTETQSDQYSFDIQPEPEIVDELFTKVDAYNVTMIESIHGYTISGEKEDVQSFITQEYNEYVEFESETNEDWLTSGLNKSSDVTLNLISNGNKTSINIDVHNLVESIKQLTAESSESKQISSFKENDYNWVEVGTKYFDEELSELEDYQTKLLIYVSDGKALEFTGFPYSQFYDLIGNDYLNNREELEAPLNDYGLSEIKFAMTDQNSSFALRKDAYNHLIELRDNIVKDPAWASTVYSVNGTDDSQDFLREINNLISEYKDIFDVIDYDVRVNSLWQVNDDKLIVTKDSHSQNPTGKSLTLNKGTRLRYETDAPNGNVWFYVQNNITGEIRVKIESGTILNLIKSNTITLVEEGNGFVVFSNPYVLKYLGKSVMPPMIKDPMLNDEDFHDDDEEIDYDLAPNFNNNTMHTENYITAVTERISEVQERGSAYILWHGYPNNDLVTEFDENSDCCMIFEIINNTNIFTIHEFNKIQDEGVEEWETSKYAYNNGIFNELEGYTDERAMFNENGWPITGKLKTFLDENINNNEEIVFPVLTEEVIDKVNNIIGQVLITEEWLNIHLVQLDNISGDAVNDLEFLIERIATHIEDYIDYDLFFEKYNRYDEWVENDYDNSMFGEDEDEVDYDEMEDDEILNSYENFKGWATGWEVNFSSHTIDFDILTEKIYDQLLEVTYKINGGINTTSMHEIIIMIQEA